MPKPPPSSQPQYISLRDFSPGVIHNLAFAGLGGSLTGFGPGAQGAASMDGTFRCISLPGGGLGPLPRRDFTVTRPSPLTGQGITNWITNFILQGVMARANAGTVAPTGFGGTGGTVPFDYPNNERDPARHNVEFIMAFTAFGANSARHVRWTRDMLFAAGNPQVLVAGDVSDLDAFDGSAVDAARDTTHFAPTYFGLGRFNPNNPDQTGQTGVIWSWNEPWKGSAGSHGAYVANIFPDPTWVARVFHFPTDFTGVFISHQNRIVCLQTFGEYERDTVVGHVDLMRTNTRMLWTNPNDVVLPNAGLNTFAGADTDNHSGYGAWGSLTAADLVLIRHGGGAILIQGNIDSPIVRRMPGVTGTYGIQSGGASTSVGFVYGVNRMGIYAWGGGNNSTPLSPQLPPDFWIHPDTESILDYKGNFAQWFDWIIAPCGWLYQPGGGQGSWWRLEDPAAWLPYEYQVNPGNGYLYSLIPLVADGGVSLSPYISGFNPSKAANSFSWRSQPMFVSRSRMVNVRELVLIAQGTALSTVVVTLQNSDGSTSVTNFVLSGATDTPQVIRKSVSSKDQANVRVLLVSTGHNAADAAPVVYGLDIEYTEREEVGQG